MNKHILRITAAALAAVLVSGNAVFADTVATAAAPGTTGNTAVQTTGTQAQTNGGVISQSGPSGQKNINEKGYLVIGNGNDSSSADSKSSVIGPGGNYVGDRADAAAQNNNSGSSAAQVVINDSIAKPSAAAEAAVLYDATTNQILFDKNGSKALAPASTTKLMTALLAVEKLSLTDTFTFSSSAVNNLESGAVTAGMKAGDSMTVKDALNAVLIRSACEVANGLAEKISGSQSDFAALMNKRAEELGCKGTHFANASGLNSDEHYTTAEDMARITAAALSNETIRSILQTNKYVLPATASRGSLTIENRNKMISTGSESYAGYLGGKTGYTSKAGNCLAGAAEYNGHVLVAVVLKAATSQYSDSKALFDYGKALIGGGSSSQSSGQSQSTQVSQTGSTDQGSWEKTENGGWKYRKSTGYCVNEWLDLGGKTYFFGSDGMMCTGWKQFTNGDWYYFNPENGEMVCAKWVTQNGKSYYLQANGAMAKNTVIDGKYKVNENGVYVEKVG